MLEIPRVVQAIPGDDFSVFAYMEDGTVRHLDMKPMLKKGGVFEPLKDKAFFEDRLTVMGGTVAWDIAGNRDEYTCVDIDPCGIQDLPVVSDPLAAEAVS